MSQERPLYDAVCAYAAQAPTRFHVPGHKGKALPFEGQFPLSALDLTELSVSGNLYDEGGPIATAESLWARVFGFHHAFFLTGGSTQGILTAFSACFPPGSQVLIDRESHRSVHNATALLDIRPVFLERPVLREQGVSGPVLRETVRMALEENPDIRGVCLTSPTYYGVLSDIAEISEETRARGIPLVVDGAHGAHLPFLGEHVFWGASLLIVSAHKTLPVLGQGALLFADERFSPHVLRQSSSVFGTSSPSYPIMASMDCARAYMESEGAEAYRGAIRALEAFARRLRPPFSTLRGTVDKSIRTDPARLVIHTGGFSGVCLAEQMEREGVYLELSDLWHLVCVVTARDGAREFDALERALLTAAARLVPNAPRPCPVPPTLPQRVRMPREACFGEKEWILLQDAAGRVCAGHLAPYPPGIPILTFGEKIEEKHLAYFKEIGYNEKEIAVLKGT